MNNIRRIADRYAEAKARLNLVQAELESKINAVKQLYGAEIELLEKSIQECAEQIKKHADEKGIGTETVGSIKFGYREGKNKIKVEDEEALIEELEKSEFLALLRVKVELDKHALLKECLLSPDFARGFGIEIVKERKFYIETL